MSATVLCKSCGEILSNRDFSEPSAFIRQRSRLYAPLDSVETYEIISWVSEADLDLAKLDEEIQRSKDTLKSLENQREEVKRYRGETQSLFSPVRRLPVEVLEQVFDLACFSESTCLSSSTHYALDITINSARAWTLDLSQVCSVWRQIIRSRPSLWSSLWIDLSHQHRAFEVMKHYLERSQRAPLTLFITAGDLDEGPMEDDDDVARSMPSAECDVYRYLPMRLRDYSWEVLELLFLFSERWNDVTMCLSWNALTEISLKFDLRNINLEQVVALNLDWTYNGEASELDSFMLSFTHLPSLRRLYLTEFKPWFNLPLHRITTLGPMSDWTASGVVHALGECRNVDSFKIIFSGEPFTLETSPPIVINARSLDIACYYNDFYIDNDVRSAKLLNSLTAAQLENLACKGLLMDEGWQTSFRNFISRSRCPLKTLILHCEYTRESYIPQLLSLLPTLTNVELHYNRATIVDASVFDGLITTVESSSIVPRLQQLSLSCCAFKTKTQPLLLVSHVLTMAESRSTSRVEFLNIIRLSIELYRVSSRNECDLDPESLLRLQRLNGGGMEVSITLDPSYL